MDYKTIIGLVSGFLTTISFVPQVIKAWKTKSTKDISLGMFSVLTIGTIMWIIYGILINSLPVLATNSVTLVLVGAILVCKIKYK